MVEKYQREVSEAQAALYEEGQNRTRLQMELDAKESEIEALVQKVALSNSDTASLHSANDAETAGSGAEDGYMGGWPGVASGHTLPRLNCAKLTVVTQFCRFVWM